MFDSGFEYGSLLNLLFHPLRDEVAVTDNEALKRGLLRLKEYGTAFQQVTS
jgi:hypothetical protein